MPPAGELYAENLALKQELAEVRAQLEWLKRKVFGGGQSEKLGLHHPRQEHLPLPDVPAAAAVPTAVVTYERRKPSLEKRPVPAETFAKLPVKETIELVPAEVKAEPAAFEKISEERTFEVDIVPPKLFKREIMRPKYRRREERTEAPVIAPAPARVVPGGYASAGLVACIIVSKYQHHLPLYRLALMSAQWGAPLSRQTMVEWVRVAAEWCEVLYKRMVAELLAGGYVHRQEELVVHRASGRRPVLGDPLLAHRFVPASRPGPARISARRAHAPAAHDQPRRPHAAVAAQLGARRRPLRSRLSHRRCS